MSSAVSNVDVAPSMESPPTPPRPARWLALGAVAGPILFTLAWLILGFVSPGFPMFDMWISPYSPISQHISGLGLGVTGPFMNVVFVLSAALIFAGEIGIFHSIRELDTAARWKGIALLALSPLGMAMDGLFTLESMMLHTLGFLLGVGSLVGSYLVVGRMLRRIPRWRQFGNWLLAGSPLTLALLVLMFATFDPVAAGEGLGVGGLTERILVVEALGWLAAFGWLAFARGGSSIPGQP